MSEFRVASRYAKSLIELAEERGVLEDVHNDMLLFSEICDENRDFLLMIKNPIINNAKKLTILKKLFSGRANKLTLAFFEIISRKNRESVLPAIAREFHFQYNTFKGIVIAKVTTTIPLDNKLRNEFKAIVRKMVGKEVELKEGIDKDLIGGYILKVDDKQIDDSLHSKLQELKLKLNHNSYVREF